MILLTGASGFIGKHLLKALIDKYGASNVLALTSSPITSCKYLLHNNYNFQEDFFEKNGYASLIDTVIHAGAYTPKVSAQANNWKKCNENIYNTEALIRANLPSLKKLIYLSTIDIYGKSDIIAETSVIEPISLYGYSKLYAEKLVEVWANESDKIHQILRVGHVYGPGEEAYQKIIPITIKNINENKPIQIWGTGEELRAFIYIDDIINSILNSINLNESNGPINLVGANAITINRLINKIIEITGKDVAINRIPTNNIGRDLIFDNSKMKQYLLQFETSLDDGLKKEWEYVSNQ